VGVGTGMVGKNLGMTGLGVGIGRDSGSASSITSAGISGIAGDTSVRSTDAETGIARIFEKERVQREIDAQTRITEAFGREASKAVGDYAAGQMVQADTLRTQARNESDVDRQRALNAQADQIEADWGDNGKLRLAAHTVIGGLTGGTSGAAGAAAGTLSAPVIADALQTAGINGPLASTLTGIGSALVGAAAGGTAGGAAAVNEVGNNYLKHEEIGKLLKAQANCDNGSVADCNVVSDLRAVDKRRQEEIQAACTSITSDTCRAKLTEAGRDFDALVLYQQGVWEDIKNGKITYSQMAPYLSKVAIEIKDIAGPLKDYYYAMSGGDPGPKEKPNAYWAAYKQIEGLNAGDLANLWNATAAIGRTRSKLLPDGPSTTTTNNSSKRASTSDGMLPEADFANRPAGINETTPIKDNFGKPPSDSDLATHLSTGGPSSKSVFGAHSELSYQAELKSIGGIEVGKPVEIAPGVWEHLYNTPDRVAAGKSPLTKTTYDGSWTDKQILEMSKQASSKVWTSIQETKIIPTKPVEVVVNNVPYRVLVSVDASGRVTGIYSHPGKK